MDLIYFLVVLSITIYLMKYGLPREINNYLLRYRYYYWFHALASAMNTRIQNKIIDYICNNWVKDIAKVIRHPGYLDISYVEEGQTKRVFVPLKPEQCFPAMQCEVNIIYDEAHGQQLKQDNDIPIMITAKDLNAKHIQVSNNFNQEERIYKGEEKVEYFC